MAVIRAAVLGADLHDSLVLLGRLDQPAPFPDGQAGVLLNVNVLSGLAGPDGGQAMPVLGRGDLDRIHVLVAEDLLHVLDPLGGIALEFRQACNGLGPPMVVDVTDVFHFDVLVDLDDALNDARAAAAWPEVARKPLRVVGSMRLAP